jgi:hypothetical protein
MKNIMHVLIPIAAGTISFGVAVGVAADVQSAASSAPRSAPTSAVSAPVEHQRNTTQKEGDRAVDQVAVAALAEAQKAVRAIGTGKREQALAAIERATGKIAVLTARKPSAALIPVKSEVAIIDLAPKDRAAIEALTGAARDALSKSDYPTARAFLDHLASEIHVKTYNLPLATYPAAMQTAARLLDEKMDEAAKQTLLTALNTLVITDTAIPLPLVEVQASIKEAQMKQDQDKPGARALLGAAKQQLDRAQDLGYAYRAPEYASLSESISELDRRLGGTQNTTSAFASLKDKMTAFFERIAHQETPRQAPAKG